MRPRHAGLFHVAARSNSEERICRDDRDYRAGVRIIASLVREGFFRCHGFCLMPTHYHLLAWFEEDMLRKATHRLNRRYAGGFNQRHGRRGHVFDSPYASVPVLRQEHADHLQDYKPWLEP